MPRRLRSTIRGKFWQAYLGSFKHCYACGKKLIRKYVKEEKSWRRVCKVCKTITYMNPRVIAGLIPVTSEGKVVLMRRNIEPALGRWSHPAGFLELGETVAQAAARETWEEVGIKVKVTRLVGIYSYSDAGVVTIVYEGRVLKNQKPKTTPEAMEVATVSPQKIPWKTLAFRSTSHALRDWHEGVKSPLSHKFPIISR